jgi:hypothetical protein
MKSNKKVYLLLAGILGLLVAAYFLFVYVFPGIAIKFVSEDREVAMGNELYQQWVANQEINQEATLAIQDFAIWGITTVIGLYLVFSNTVGPTGAAAYNFGTDFLPLLNAGRLLTFGFKKVIKSTE